MTYYVKNKDMLAALDESDKAGAPNETLFAMFQKMVTGYGRKPNFSGYGHLNDMKQEALLMCFEKWTKFDKTKSQNPFAYFTQIIHNSFLASIKKEDAQKKLREKIKMKNYYGIQDGAAPGLSWHVEFEEELEKMLEEAPEHEEKVIKYGPTGRKRKPIEELSPRSGNYHRRKKEEQ